MSRISKHTATDDRQVLESFRQAIMASKTRLLNVRTDRDTHEIPSAGWWTRRLQVLSMADVTASAEFVIPLAALREGLWLEIGNHGQAPLLELASSARPREGIDVLAACLEDETDLMPHLVMPELELYPICHAPGWAELQRQWSYRGRLTADRTGLRCHLLIDLKAS